MYNLIGISIRNGYIKFYIIWVLLVHIFNFFIDTYISQEYKPLFYICFLYSDR